MKRLFPCLTLAALMLSPACFADDPLPSAETILDHYVEVTGGKAAYEKRTSEMVTGVMEFPAQGLKGTLTRYAAAPDHEYSSIDLAGVGKIEEGVEKGVAWEKSAIMGSRIKSGIEKMQAVREATLNEPIIWRKLYTKVETTGIESLDGEDCYKVVVTPEGEKPETRYYSKKSGLLLKTQETIVSQMGEIEAEGWVSEYKEFGGVLEPTKLRQKAAGQEFVVSIQSVKVNPEIPPDQFKLPAEVQALVDKK